jgi:glycosyltransferase involved in cell wall biosynthesis
MPTIGLSMIVRNEAKLIVRCLESVRPLVDVIYVSDTGSDDKTVGIIYDFMKEYNINGVVVDTRWRDFSHNRNIALDILRKVSPQTDYAFMIDADDQLEIAPDFDIAAFKAGMDKDVYDIPVSHGGVVHSRPQIFRNRPGYHFVGVLHEFLEVDQKPFTRATVSGLLIKASIEGSRNADPQKFEKDALLLEKALATEKDEYLRARYTFYLAQSYRDSGQHDSALKYYLARSNMGIWDQEVYVSLVEAIRCYARLDEQPFVLPINCFERAAKILPGRAEAYHGVSFLCRQKGENQEGTRIARLGLHLTTPPDGLFIEPWIYDYGLRDEYAVNAYWAGHYLECLDSCLQLLASPKTPPDMHKRLADNALAALAKLKPRFVANTSLVFSD